jgi:hypothetical protein
MLARVVFFCLMMSAASAAATAQPTAPQQSLPQAPAAPSSPDQASQPPAAPAPPAQGQPPSRVFCDQNVAYQLADPASVPGQYRRFVGVWSDAAWNAKTCAALIVEDVKPDGAASIIYVVGPEGSSSTVPGAVLHGTGVIRDDELRFQNTDGSQYAFRPSLVDMIGHWINPQGESFQATFKMTP